jgi:proline iminopeptidase
MFCGACATPKRGVTPRTVHLPSISPNDVPKARRSLYPTIEPHTQGDLEVSSRHRIYYEVSGRKEGKAAVYLHGGPGAGSAPVHRQYFDPNAYRIVLFDQRGSGRSTPHADVEANTTWDLVEDMEKLRRHLGLESWLVCGGSWGSTLALAYAETHPEYVRQIVLRGIFMLREKELTWFYQEGTSYMFPEAWEKFLAPIPQEERHNLLQAYARRLFGPDRSAAMAAARAWSVWEGSTLSLLPDRQREQAFAEDAFALAFARIECHYFVNEGFFQPRDQLLRNIDRIRHIPGVIVQGRYDVVTPAVTAWELHQAWPEAEFRLIPDAGHAASEPGIIDAIIEATDRFATD